MLGLRYVVCDRCETVFAVPETPSRCQRCDAPALRAVESGTGAAAYFSPCRGGDAGGRESSDDTGTDDSPADA